MYIEISKAVVPNLQIRYQTLPSEKQDGSEIFSPSLAFYEEPFSYMVYSYSDQHGENVDEEFLLSLLSFYFYDSVEASIDAFCCNKIRIKSNT